MNYKRSVSEFVDLKRHQHISVTRKLKNYHEIDENLYLDSYTPGVNKEICERFNVDFVKILNKEKFNEDTLNNAYKSVSISTAAASVSYICSYLYG